MKDAFDRNNSNFDRMITGVDGPTYITDVLHKTYISVDNEGTRAAAVTAILVATDACAEPSPSYRVVLDRPFVYMITDSEGLPIFIGTYE